MTNDEQPQRPSARELIDAEMGKPVPDFDERSAIKVLKSAERVIDKLRDEIERLTEAVKWWTGEAAAYSRNVENHRQKAEAAEQKIAEQAAEIERLKATCPVRDETECIDFAGALAAAHRQTANAEQKIAEQAREIERLTTNLVNANTAMDERDQTLRELSDEVARCHDLLLRSRCAYCGEEVQCEGLTQDPRRCGAMREVLAAIDAYMAKRRGGVA